MSTPSLVASNPENFHRYLADLWDSGKVDSEQSTFVAYKGWPQASGMTCHWKVRA